MIEKQKIDYDKNPIEIKDYNTLFYCYGDVNSYINLYILV
ncbi:hypothetical protein SDC9_19455 [bioreactor metagenome]|uniref:Uncharacterized protein n=1 Tax=bioreactor metagenome TaxID=1076179 RepID=A0A644U3H3_9ZZZZ